MEPTEQPSKRQHIAVFPFPFGSHPLPLLTLVRRLAAAAPGATFSFFGTAESNKSLFNSHPTANVRPLTIPDGVPAGHVFSGHPLEPINMFLESAPSDLRRAVAGESVTCVVADAFLSFSADIAAELGVPWVPVWLPLSASLPVHADTLRLRGERSAGGDVIVIPGLTGLTVADLPEEVLKDTDTPFAHALCDLGRVLPLARGIVVNFYRELNPPELNSYLDSKYPNVLNVGFLTTAPTPPSESDECLAWLDGERDRSVAYVSFGTVASPPAAEVRALAEALEEAGVPYLWSMKDGARAHLPEGFESRTRGRVVAWAPQVAVLGHAAVGVFVTHCGCNSVFESVARGVPLICRPFFGDHHLGGWMVQDYWRVGLRVAGGAITRAGLVGDLRAVLGDGAMRERVRELRDKVAEAAGPGGTAVRDFEELVRIISGACVSEDEE